MVNSKTKLIATAHVSNVLGCEAPVAEIVELARKHGKGLHSSTFQLNLSRS